MKKSSFTFLFLILIVQTYCSGDSSHCIGSSATDDSGRRRVSSEFFPEDCATLDTMDNAIYKCVVNDKGDGCKEVEKSECDLFPNLENYRRRVSTDYYSQEDCAPLKTQDNTKYKCVINDKGNGCIEVFKSECERYLYLENDRRRVSTDTDTDIEMECAMLETSSDDYDCVPNEDGTGCEEVLIDYSNNLKITITILCLLFFL